MLGKSDGFSIFSTLLAASLCADLVGQGLGYSLGSVYELGPVGLPVLPYVIVGAIFACSGVVLALCYALVGVDDAGFGVPGDGFSSRGSSSGLPLLQI